MVVGSRYAAMGASGSRTVRYDLVEITMDGSNAGATLLCEWPIVAEYLGQTYTFPDSSHVGTEFVHGKWRLYGDGGASWPIYLAAYSENGVYESLADGITSLAFGSDPSYGPETSALEIVYSPKLPDRSCATLEVPDITPPTIAMGWTSDLAKNIYGSYEPYEQNGQWYVYNRYTHENDEGDDNGIVSFEPRGPAEVGISITGYDSFYGVWTGVVSSVSSSWGGACFIAVGDEVTVRGNAGNGYLVESYYQSDPSGNPNAKFLEGRGGRGINISIGDTITIGDPDVTTIDENNSFVWGLTALWDPYGSTIEEPSSYVIMYPPAAVPGKARDYLVRVVMDGDPVSEKMTLLLSMTDSGGAPVTYSSHDGAFPLLRQGSNLFSFSEIAPGRLMLSRKMDMDAIVPST